MEAVGEPIARRAWPARIARDGTLHVNTADSVWAFELGQRAADVAARLGVAAVRFSPGPLPETDAPVEAAKGPDPTAEQRHTAAEIASAISDPELRERVERTVGLGLARGCLDRPL